MCEEQINCNICHARIMAGDDVVFFGEAYLCSLCVIQLRDHNWAENAFKFAQYGKGKEVSREPPPASNKNSETLSTVEREQLMLNEWSNVCIEMQTRFQVMYNQLDAICKIAENRIKSRTDSDGGSTGPSSPRTAFETE